MSEQDNILKLKDWIENSDNIVFFGGAGVSTESGVPDFRSENGIYNTVKRYNFPPGTPIFSGISIVPRWTAAMQSRTRRIWRWRSWSVRAS